jgi:hypothetical protein
MAARSSPYSRPTPNTGERLGGGGLAREDPFHTLSPQTPTGHALDKATIAPKLGDHLTRQITMGRRQSTSHGGPAARTRSGEQSPANR